MFLKYIQGVRVLSRCIVGFRSLFKDPDAFLVDFNDPVALHPHLSMIESCVLVPKSLAIMRTQSSRQDWIASLTQYGRGEFSARVFRIRRRKGGRERAKPATLPQQMRSTGAGTFNTASHSVLHFVNAPVSVARHVVVHVMLKVAMLLGIPLTQVPTEQHVPTDETCYQTQNGRTEQWNGKVFVWLRSIEEHQALHKLMHGTSVTMYGNSVVVEVSNTSVTFDHTRCENFLPPAASTSSNALIHGFTNLSAQGSLRSGGQ